MDERMDAPNGKRIVELLRKAATGGYEGEKGSVMNNLAQLIDCDGDMHFHTIGKLADMVDEAIQHEHESAYDEGWDAGFASADDWCAQHEDEMAEHGWVRLPKDADGEYIHVGDVMDGIDKYNSLREVTGRVITISFEADGLVDVAVQARNDDGKSWRRAYLDPCASLYRHHHEPTVEDVLRDYGSRILIAGCIDEEDALVAEYAAKLQLRGDAE